MKALDSRTLIQAQRAVKVPFVVEAVIDKTPDTETSVTQSAVTRQLVSREPKLDQGQTIQIEIHRVFRLLPGKRIVGLAKCGDTKLLVKLFLGRQAKRYAAKERRGIKRFKLLGYDPLSFIGEPVLKMVKVKHLRWSILARRRVCRIVGTARLKMTSV